MFVDQRKIYVKAGDGGNGCRSLYRDRFNRRGKPDGGDGGRGGDIIFQSDSNITTLIDFKFRQHFRASSGAHGSSNRKKGKGGNDLIVKVPIGTTIKDINTNTILKDLSNLDMAVVVARGGRGGKGNKNFKDATVGESGEEKELLLDLKLIADVGLIGFPNAGKSTLISSISNARPRIASFPFTTLSPILGVVKSDNFSFVVADIPGLIEGSHQGKGLGISFLRHIERTKVLVHLIDMAAIDNRDPIEDYQILNKELLLYSKELLSKPHLIVANKMDLSSANKNLVKFKKKVKEKIYPISALKKEGLEKLIEAIRKKL